MLPNFELADYDLSGNSGKIDALIGSDHYWDVVSGDIIREASGPVAIKSIIGWLLLGPIKTKKAQTLVTVNLSIQGADEMCTDRDFSEDDLKTVLGN